MADPVHEATECVPTSGASSAKKRRRGLERVYAGIHHLPPEEYRRRKEELDAANDAIDDYWRWKRGYRFSVASDEEDDDSSTVYYSSSVSSEDNTDN